MPDGTPEGASREAPSAHRLRAIAESFGVDAARYDRTRPPYPSDMIDQILADIPGHDVLDVGCGTGIEARQFQAAGCDVIGVEPDERMAEFARATGVTVEVSTFEAWASSGRRFDAVISGTAWHWVDPVIGATKAAQVMRPGGRIAAFHHVIETPPVIADATSEAYRKVAPDSPLARQDQRSATALEMYQPLFDRIADGMRAAIGLSEPEQWNFPWQRTVTRDEWLDHLPTFGGMTQLGPEALRIVTDRVGTAIDTIGNELTVPYTTVVITARYD